jgi:hypothetical protein
LNQSAIRYDFVAQSHLSGCAKRAEKQIEREFALAPDDIRRRIRWLPIGAAVELAAFSE